MENQSLHLDQGAKLDSISRGIQDLEIDTSKKAPDAEELFSVSNLFSGEDAPPGTRFKQVDLSADQLDKCREKLLQLTGTWADINRAQSLLASLDFDARSSRYNTIPQAHMNTFEWIFGTNFTTWLKSDNGIFWISGKAGSGKSTLMKYIVDHPRTQELLFKWSSPKPVSIASHYFWAAGAATQKSETGLLRTLLYEVFVRCPLCMPIIAPDRWERAGSRKLGQRAPAIPEPWSRTELSKALQALANYENISTKFCFFIDGMDEYNDDHSELCEVLKTIVKSPNIRLCVSSRPWNIFQDSFGQEQAHMIQVHNFTQKDIERFARDRLECHPAWSTRRFQQRQTKDKIIRDIRDRAEGVFLWAFLVTRSLRDGLTNGDTIMELQGRLDALPSDLENLFKHMLGQIDPVYYEQMAGMFQIALHAKEPLKMDIYGYYDREFEDEHYALKMPVKDQDIDKLLDLYDITRRRVNSRSNGMLECGAETYTVQFLHRTVSDFLRTGEMLEYIHTRCRPGSDVYLSVFKALMAKIKSTSFKSGVLRAEQPSGNTGRLVEELDNAMRYASLVETKTSLSVFDLLDELELALEEMFRTGQASFDIGSSCEPKVLFRETILRSNLAAYVRQKLKDIPGYLSKLQASPIIIAATAIDPPVDTLRTLLQNGEDPNGPSELYGRVITTPWLYICFAASPWSYASRDSKTLGDILENGLFMLFLSYGANPNSSQSDCNFTAFAMYLMVAFCDPGYILKVDQYLRTLKSFLDHGADLKAEVRLGSSFYRRLPRCLCWWPNQGETITVVESFRRGLKVWAETPGLRQTNGRFLSEVVKTLIMHSATARICVDQLLVDLKPVFGEHIAIPIMHSLNSDNEKDSEGSRMKKRQMHGDETDDAACHRSGKRHRENAL